MLRKLKSSLNLKSTLPTRKTELDAKDIMAGFEHISKHLRAEYPDTTFHIIVSGGTCSVLLLKNRVSTQDIDFFVPDPEVITAVLDAKRSLPKEKRDKWPLSWINAEMIAYVSNHPGCEHLYDTSIKEDVIIYKSDVLVAYAEDWRYQLLVGKIVRAYQIEQFRGDEISAGREGKDLNDAVSILRELVARNVRTWYNYGPALEDTEIEYVNAEYRKQFGSNEIV